ncbi:MAG TPA: TIGR03960 family B12-binding radical SAM protein, partial [Thermoanaerobaculia bacterium]|nr:TIGR03960 family B12-binding radical SAM protein [Thermoanaerobaculia bacterium]
MRFVSVRPKIDPLLPFVERPGRYVGLERNLVRKDLAKAKATIALAFPDTYEIGMSHTGLRILYEIVNRRPEWACERVFAPWTDLEERMRERGIPLFSVESLSPAADFDALGFSLQAEINYSNVVNMLDLAGIPLLQRDRRPGDPVVIGGGPCTANPEPLAIFFDVFLIGDAEEALPVFLERLEAWRSAGGSREAFLEDLARVPGFYVPSLYDVAYREDGAIASITPNRPGIPDRARRVWIERLSASHYPEKPVVPSVDIVQDRLGLEIMRGCTQGCRFCQAGYWYRPVRELDPADAAEMTKRFIRETGWSEVGLLSLSTADYSQIEPLVSCLAPQLAEQRVSISLPSLRAEAFSVGLADAVSEVRKSGFTFAPETGSDRLRRVINKTFTNADMVKAADAAFSRGWDLIKVYTMIGLPTETEADLDELVTLVRDILAQGRRYGRKNVNVSVGSFVPKSWTPFQWSAFDGTAKLEAKVRYLQEKLRSVRGAKMKSHSPAEAEIECVLSRGDRRMGEVLLEAWKRGVKFDGWSEHFRYDLWREAFDACRIPPERYLREYGVDEVLPWDVIDAAVTKKFLKIERIKALREHETQDCKWGHCYACGVPGNGEDTVLARPMTASTLPVARTNVPAAAPAAGSPAALPAAYTEAAKGAAYREKAMPDVASAPRRRPGFGSDPRPRLRYRLTFEKLGDARFLSHRNTMDAFERGIRAAGMPAAYSEGFNPRMRLSMGPALALGLESREEVLDLETTAPLPADAALRISDRLPPGIRVTAAEALAPGAPPLSKAIRGAAYSLRLDPSLRERAREAASGETSAAPAVRS